MHDDGTYDLGVRFQWPPSAGPSLHTLLQS
jgi:hypothetical protein